MKDYFLLDILEHQISSYFFAKNDCVVVVKIGGFYIQDDKQHLLDQLLKDIVYWSERNIFFIIVHGGGYCIESLAPNKIGGYRVTPEERLNEINFRFAVISTELKAKLIDLGSSKEPLILNHDTRFVSSVVKNDSLGGTGTPLGFYSNLFCDIRNKENICIVPPITHSYDKRYDYLNVNADVLAYFIAVNTFANYLLVLTDSDGIIDDNGNTLLDPSTSDIKNLHNNKIISDGMYLKSIYCAELVASSMVHYAKITQVVEGVSLKNTIINDSGTLFVNKNFSN